jgi:hypothetical protein
MHRRIRPWLRETHGTQFELVRHFLGQQFAYELLSSDQLRRLVITVLAALGCAGPLIIRLYLPKYADLQGLPSPDLYQAAVIADRLFFISLSMIIVGLLSAFQWQNLFPNRQDYLTLKPLPVRLYQVFVARFAAAAVIFVVVVADVNLATSVLFPFITSGKWQVPPFGFRYVYAHAGATLGAGLFIFLAMVAVQGIGLTLLSPRAFDRASVLMQAFLFTWFVAAVPYVFDMPNWHRMIGSKPHWLAFFPPAWFLGLYERLLGTHDAYFLRLSRLAVCGLWTTFAVALASYLVSYRRHAIRILEQSLPKRRTDIYSIIAGVIAERLIRSSHERAIFDFVGRTLQRSRHHRLVLGFAVGVAVVLSVQSVGPAVVTQFRSGQLSNGWEIEPILALPLVIGAVLISAFCYLFQLPSELRANWVFRMAENCGRRELLDGVERVLIVCGVVPAILLALPIEALAVGWASALAHSALMMVLLLLLLEMRLREWHKIPFTCSYVPGRRNIWQSAGAYLFLFGILIPVIGFFEMQMLRWFLLVLAAAPLTVGYIALRSGRRRQWAIVPLLFDESEEPLIMRIRLS